MWFAWNMDGLLGYASTRALVARAHGLGDGRSRRIRPGLYELVGSMDDPNRLTGIWISTRPVAVQEGIPDEEITDFVNRVASDG